MRNILKSGANQREKVLKTGRKASKRKRYFRMKLKWTGNNMRNILRKSPKKIKTGWHIWILI